jgi:hypothetical protein
MIDKINKNLWAAFAVLTMLVVCCLPKQASAEVIATGCVLKKPFNGARAGQKVDIVIVSSNQQPTNFGWVDEFCQDRPVSYQISGTINNQMESDFRTLYNALKGDALFQKQKANYVTPMVHVNSEGGSVSSAIRIGRMLRDLNAWTMVPAAGTCSSSCVFLLIGGVNRDVWGRVGVHRPYFESLDRRRTQAEVSADIRGLDAMIITYLRDMNISSNFLDFMKGVPPDQMRWLSDSDLQTFGLSAPDPVFDELRIAQDAWRHGTTSAIFRQRMVESRRCFSGAGLGSLPPGAWECHLANLYGIRVDEWRLRGQRVSNLCRGMTSTTFANCERDVMIGSRR